MTTLLLGVVDDRGEVNIQRSSLPKVPDLLLFHPAAAILREPEIKVVDDAGKNQPHFDVRQAAQIS